MKRGSAGLLAKQYCTAMFQWQAIAGGSQLKRPENFKSDLGWLTKARGVVGNCRRHQLQQTKKIKEDFTQLAHLAFSLNLLCPAFIFLESQNLSVSLDDDEDHSYDDDDGEDDNDAEDDRDEESFFRKSKSVGFS